MAASFNNNDDNDVLPNENDITIVEQDSEEESESSEEFNFAATLALRKNLVETFDQHVHSSVTQKIAHLEQRLMQKPPRQAPSKNKNKQATRCLSVYLRVRPLSSNNNKETTTTTNTVEILEPATNQDVATTVRTYPPVDSNAAKVVRDSDADGAVGGIKQFQFQQVFGPESTQQDLYAQVAAPMVHGLFPAGAPSTNKTSSLVGESALLFAYGITNAGKTHTVMGNVGKGYKKNNIAAPSAKWGIVPRAIHDVFDKMSSSTQKYNLHLSYLEIYNENIYDLLPKEKKNAPGSFSCFSAPAGPLRLREGPYGDTFVRGLAKRRVRDLNHGLELAERAQARRHTSSNNINADSSRSHCICQLQITAVTGEHAAVVNDDNDSVASTASGYSTDQEALQISRQKNKTVTMWIVDLAGSERSKRTGGARQKEAALINSSLMKLMRCLSVMRENQQHSSSARDVIPYRESKLTHLFMNHLSGKSASRTCMIVNINPASPDFDETQHVLSYAVAAKTVQISQEDYMKKRKAMNGNTNREATHGYDGRLLNPRPEKRSKIARLVQKFSPKRLSPKRAVHKKKKAVVLGKDKKKAAPTDTKKRKAELLTMRGTSAVAVASSDAPKAKMPRLGVKTKSVVSQSSSTVAVKNYEKELKSLQASLLIARAEAEVLKSEKKALEDEISQIEEQVRMEVAEETEHQMRAMTEQYSNTIDRLKLQIQTNPTPARSVRKARADKAEQVLEELMDKVDECEEEMVRMREKHEEEMAKLQQHYEEEMQAKDEEILKAKSTFEEEMQAQKAEMAKLQRRVEGYQVEVEELRKSNQDLAETYDTIIGEDEEQKSVGESRPANSSEEEPVLSPKNNSTSESNAKEVVDHSENTENKMALSSEVKPIDTVSRAPLSTISNKQETKKSSEVMKPTSPDLSEIDSSSDDDDMLLMYPKKPTIQDEDGEYQRPRGRAPSGREWDSQVGAWRLSIV